MTPTPRKMIQSALLSCGADGLCNGPGRCGCPIRELAPLGDCLDLDECLPARFVDPTNPGADLDLLQEWPYGYYVQMEAERE